MSTIFWKNILKCLHTALAPHPSEQNDHSLLHPLPSSSSKTTIVIQDFNSVCDISSTSTSKSLCTDSSFSSSTNHADADAHSDSIAPPDFSTILASQRFFFTSPGHSNSIIQTTSKAPPETTSSSSSTTPLTGGGVAVKKYSPDPYTDFKHSMQEMIEAREVRDVRANWKYLHELLSCYLTLNPRQTHHIIITAFADIIVCLMSEESDNHGKSRQNKNGDGTGGDMKFHLS